MRIVIATRSPVLGAVLVSAFQDVDGLEVTASVSSVAEVVAQSRCHSPEVVVCSADLSEGTLIEIIPRILRGAARVLVVCDDVPDEDAAMLLLAGASGCLYVNDSGPEDVVAAVRQVAAGAAALHPAAAATVLRMWRAERSSDLRREDADGHTPPPALTTREAQVLDALARGLPTKSIGRELGVSPKTVESHIARVLAKLGARNRAHAVALAEGLGLLDRAGGN